MAAVYDIDKSRIYSTGMSNGGYMSYLLACGSTDKFAAIASVTGSMTTDTFDNCAPSRPISTLQIHGELDGTVPIDGSLGTLALADVIDYGLVSIIAMTLPLPWKFLILKTMMTWVELTILTTIVTMTWP